MSQEAAGDSVEEKSGETNVEAESRSSASELSNVDDNEPSDAPGSSEVAAEDFEHESDGAKSVSMPEEEEQYEEEERYKDDAFVSMSEDFSAQRDIIVETETENVIVSQQLDIEDNTNEPNHVPEISEVAEEEDYEQENDRVKSVSVQEEKEQYEDEFVSMREDLSAQKDIIVEAETEDNTNEPSNVSGTSEVAEEEDDYEHDQVKSVSVQEEEQYEEEQYEDDAFVSMSEDFSAHKGIVVEAEIIENTEIVEQEEEDNEASVHGDSEYDDDFASVSENTQGQTTDLANNSAVDESEIEEHEEHEKAIDTGEISSDSEHESRASGDEIGGSDEREYSTDNFESEHLEESTLPRIEPILEEQSVGVQVGHSSSEDSSMTNLLVAEVAALQEAANATFNARSEENKIANKKAKVEELLRAKERILSQQKEVFRREEEKRRVDLFAKLALGVDVEGELRRAKDEISQHLARDFDALQETYPILKISENVASTKERKKQTPSVMSKLFGKNAIDRSAVVEESYNEYGAESFEEVHNDELNTSKVGSDEVVEDDKYGAESFKVVQNDEHNTSEVGSDEAEEDDEYEAGEVHNDEHNASEVGIDEAVEDEEYDAESFEEAQNDEHNTAEVDSDEVMEDEYDAESFEDVQNGEHHTVEVGSDKALEDSAAHKTDAVEAENLSVEVTSDVPSPQSDINEDVVQSVVDDDADNVVGEQEATGSNAEVAITKIVEPTKEESAKEEELSEAIENIVAQLQDEQVSKPVSPAKHAPDHAESAPNESRLLDVSVSVSLSRSDEAESFTTSIEERTARLEALKQRIEVRKTEILAVQKQMRVERRREKLVADEKLLWDEMESVQRLLRADEAALALSQQRNRLEMMHLKAREMKNFVDRNSNKKVYEQESNMLLGFDYIEEAQPTHNQERYESSLPRRDHTIRGFDLLEGYAYVEAAESGDFNEYKSTAGILGTKSCLSEGSSGAAESGSVKSDDDEHGTEFTEDKALSYETTSVDTHPLEKDDKGSSVIQHETDIQPPESDNYEDIVSDQQLNLLSADLLSPLSNELHPSDAPPGKDHVDRVTDLLYADLFQEVEEDIMTAIRSKRTVQDKPQEEVNTGLLGVEGIPQIPSASVNDELNANAQTSDVGDDSIDSRYTADWNVDQSSENVILELTRMEPPIEDLGERVDEEEIASVEDSNSAMYADSFHDESSFNFKEDDELSTEISPTQESSSKNPTKYMGSVVKVDRQREPENESEEKQRETIDATDKIHLSERVADAIFATVFDEVISSELQQWSRRQPTDKSTSSPQVAIKRSGTTSPSPAKSTPDLKMPIPRQDPRARDLAITRRILDQLEIFDGEIRLPALNSFAVGNDSYNARVLYDSVEAIACDCFSAIQQSLSNERTLDSASVLAVVHRHVQAKIEELLIIRAQPEHELERQLQLISDESGAETGLTTDVLLSQNCIASNVSSIVAKVQSDISRRTEELSTTMPPTRPRTPISRAKNTSILSSLQIQQDEELQQRIASMILSDLLHDAGL
ncbi:hypothetical protein L915_04090 [Phytophthora nicotianae]|uniref:Uncharacterized protein n=1 Tax=Phytophthora nicotianae TaxID=4792 RepID=W2HBF4_PHYNI|nr:hypothetical protein L915_04090 [Phytophthora nicotianae]